MLQTANMAQAQIDNRKENEFIFPITQDILIKVHQKRLETLVSIKKNGRWTTMTLEQFQLIANAMDIIELAGDLVSGMVGFDLAQHNDGEIHPEPRFEI